PHGALDACTALQRIERLLDRLRWRELAHADGRGLGRRYAQRHLVLGEVDHEQLELVPGDLLFLDADDLPNAVRGVHDAFMRAEPLTGMGLAGGGGGSGLLAR